MQVKESIKTITSKYKFPYFKVHGKIKSFSQFEDVDDDELVRGISKDGNQIIFDIKNDRNLKSGLYKVSKDMYVTDYLLKHNKTNVVEGVMAEWLYNDDSMLSTYIPKDVQFNLLYYILMNKPDYKPKFNKQQLKYITQHPDELLELLGSKYIGNKDHASLLFAILTGYSSPSPNIVHIFGQYQEIKNVEWPDINLIIGDYPFDKRLSPFPPHLRAARELNSSMAKLILTIADNNVHYIIDYYKIPIPDDLDDMTLTYYVKKELSQYENVFKRGNKIKIKHSKLPKTENGLYKYFNKFTSDELLDNYKDLIPTDGKNKWRDRKDIIDILFWNFI